MIHLHIDRLVLMAGVTDPAAVARSLERELSRLLTANGLPHELSHTATLRPPYIAEPSRDASAFGVQIAGAIYHSLAGVTSSGHSSQPQAKPIGGMGAPR